MGIYWLSDIALSLASTVIVCVVFAFYLAQLFKNRSKFVYGLTLLSGALFAESLLTSFMYFKFSTQYGPELAIPLMGIAALSLIAFVAFAYVVRQRVKTNPLGKRAIDPSFQIKPRETKRGRPEKTKKDDFDAGILLVFFHE